MEVPSVAKFDLSKLGYQVQKVLGQGSWGTVVKGRHRDRPEEAVAIKIIDRTMLSASDRLNVEREAEAMLELNHTNIVKLHTVHKTPGYFYFVMEYCPGGDLLTHVQGKGSLSERAARTLFHALASAVHHAHKNNFVHRDIKLENCFMTKTGGVRLGDWGFSRRINVARGSLLKEYCGSIHYSSPEIVKGTPYKGPEVDIWSLGVTLYGMCSGLLPFYGSHETIVYSIKTSTFVMQPAFSDNLKDLIAGMLEQRLEFRMTIEEVMAHPWLVDTTKQRIVPSISANSWNKVFSSAPNLQTIQPSPTNPVVAGNTVLPVITVTKEPNTTQNISATQKQLVANGHRLAHSGNLKEKENGGRKGEKLQAFFKQILGKKQEKESKLMPSPRFKNFVEVVAVN